MLMLVVINVVNHLLISATKAIIMCLYRQYIYNSLCITVHFIYQ